MTVRHNTAWYRHPEPWLLLLAPAAAVVAGLLTWWLAATTNHSLVVDDYYREGRAINQTQARDARASELGLSAQWIVDIEHNMVRVTIEARAGDFVAGDRLFIRLVHATEARLDDHLELPRSASRRWEGPFVPPPPGRWTVRLEDDTRTWRLIAKLDDPGLPLTISSMPLPQGEAARAGPQAEPAQ